VNGPGKLLRVSEFTEMNRRLWDEWTDIHEGSDFYDLPGFMRGGIRLRDYELDEVGDVAGKSVLHLQCHFGLDSLSFARLGAQVTGADFSEKAVVLATRLAEELAMDARFVRSDVYALPQTLSGIFDLVYTSRGVLGWLPDIRRWAEVVAHFVAPGGIFYVTDAHPVAMTLDEGLPLRVKYPYWEHAEPLAFDTQGSYADPSAMVHTPKEYGWNHSLGEIVQALIDAGLTIELLHEWPFCDWDLTVTVRHENGLWYLPDDIEGELPLFFSLRARKPA
jgi:SAM-dependent methyltransferase